MRRVSGVVNLENLHTARDIFLQTIKIKPETIDNTKALIVKKFNDTNTFYKHLTGLDELEYYQDRVIELQTTLTEAQIKRRELSYLLNDIRGKGIDIQDKLHKVKRHEEPTLFLELMREETDFIKKEREIFSNLTEQERYERDVFTAFTNAIRDSQEKQRNRLEYAKYIGFGLTLMGALGSYLITTWRTQDLKTVIRDTIRADVKSIFAESTQDNLQLVSELSRQQIANQTQALAKLRASLSKEVNAALDEVILMHPQTQPPANYSLDSIGETEWQIIKWLGIGSVLLLTFSLFTR